MVAEPKMGVTHDLSHEETVEFITELLHLFPGSKWVGVVHSADPWDTCGKSEHATHQISMLQCIPHGPGSGLVPGGTRFEIFHLMSAMARRENPIPKDTPIYWRMPIVSKITK